MGTNFWVEFYFNINSCESFRQLLHMLTRCTSIRDRGMIHYQLVLLQLAPPLDNGCLVPQLESITRAGGQPACQMCGLLHALQSKKEHKPHVHTHALTHITKRPESVAYHKQLCIYLQYMTLRLLFFWNIMKNMRHSSRSGTQTSLFSIQTQE